MNIDKNIDAQNAAWTFRGIEKDFENHIRKSIPLYDHGHDIVCSYSDFFLSQNDSLAYEIGCSSGTLIKKLLTKLQEHLLFQV